jgi:hypothetical protein
MDIYLFSFSTRPTGKWGQKIETNISPENPNSSGGNSMYYVNALEYLGRDVNIRGRTMEGVEAKRFVTLKKTDTMPSREELIELARAKPGVKKVWVMEINGNKWRKAMDVIDV